MENNKSTLIAEMQKIIYAPEYEEAIKKPYDIWYKFDKEKGTTRKIEIPNELLKTKFQKQINCILQNSFERPIYCMSGWKGTNNIQNALTHAGKRFTVTADISHYFPNTKEEYIEQFWQNLGFKGEDLDRLIKITTYEGHLPTGASTSNILAALVHKPLYDDIYKEMQRQGISFTIYVDDITLSSDNHISNNVIGYLKQVLKTHCLHLKTSKIKRFGYKGAIITGVITTQAGKLQMPFKKGHKVVKMLIDQSIEEMNESKLLELIGNIAYIQQINPDGTVKAKQTDSNTKKQHLPYFYMTKQIAIQRLKQLRENKKIKGVENERI